MLEVLNQDFIRTARSKGVPWRGVIYRHALRNALIPIITITSISVGPLVGGAVLTETVFAWPGLGRYVVQSIYGRDFPAIQAIVFVSAFAFSAANLLADLAYAAVDPRIRYSR
jgi:peptide/nickel transport system permease protein